jgi:hypothetical protein
MNLSLADLDPKYYFRLTIAAIMIAVYIRSNV